MGDVGQSVKVCATAVCTCPSRSNATKTALIRLNLFMAAGWLAPEKGAPALGVPFGEREREKAFIECYKAQQN
jgi:hypothetical protein